MTISETEATARKKAIEQFGQEDVDYDHVKMLSIEAKVREYLRQQEVPVTVHNAIYAMFTLSYADWLCGSASFPIGPMDTGEMN